MLCDRYKVDNVFKSLAPLVARMEPELAAIDRVLDDDEIFAMVRADLGRRYPKTMETGRNSTPVEVIARMLVVRWLYDLSYAETEWQVSDSLGLRAFCRVYCQQVPDDTTLIRWEKLIRPETQKALNERLIAIARPAKLTRGRKARQDGTVVETNIHYPSDSSLLADGVRVLSRLVKKARPILEGCAEGAKSLFRDRTRSSKGLAREIASRAREGTERARGAYERLLAVTQASVGQAKAVLAGLAKAGTSEAEAIAEQLERYIGLAQRVVEQTKRRVLQGEQVPAGEKLVSLFEPHTCIIRRGKAGKETEFGRKVWLEEVEGGLVIGWRVEEGNAPDQSQWQASLDHHVEVFGRPPYQASADRGVYSAENERYALDLGVKRVILPQPGHRSDERRQYEKQRWFRRGRRWHAGIEGRISVLKRKHGLGRCRDHGEEGFQRWLGFAIIAANLAVMGRGLAKRTQMQHS